MFYTPGMGSNRRYADHYDRLMVKRLSEIAIRPTPVSLSEAELDVENDPVTTASNPIPIRAWVRYPETVVRAEGRAVAWTSRAVKIEWESADGEQRSAWVWASSVDRL
jgi:hypothetical protein